METSTGDRSRSDARACYASSFWWPLWKHLHDEHGLILVESECDAIAAAVDESRNVAAAVTKILERIEGLDVRKVMASTQYGMGFILSADNGICFRDDALTHAQRQQIAEAVNAHLSHNTLL